MIKIKEDLIGKTYDRKGIFLGYYNNKDDAIKSRLTAEQKYFGRFAPQRDLFEKYSIVLNETEDKDGSTC